MNDVFISIMVFDLYELHNRVIDVCLSPPLDYDTHDNSNWIFLTSYISLYIAGPVPMIETE